MPHPIIHVEFSAKDLKKSAAFYEELFGWPTRLTSAGDYAVFEAQGVAGGFNPVTDDNPAGRVVVYVQTDDLAASLKQVEDLGGKLLLDKTEMPGTGWIAIFEDPAGNAVGLLQNFPSPAAYP
jgi:predicted enzyme related to lactoylglutathione lyase